jgi:SAM-dependent methyltransferase
VRYRAPVGFYDDHPLSEDRVRRALGAGEASPERLAELDHDSYGGPTAALELARLAGVQAADRVLDVCCGMGGPARTVAARLGCRVVGVDLNQARCVGAAHLSSLVNATGVAVACADAVELPLRGGAFSAALSEDGFLHIADKGALLAECRRVLRPGGCLAFGDWTLGPACSGRDRARVATAFAADGLVTASAYATALSAAGFTAVDVIDGGAAWADLVLSRFEGYRRDRDLLALELGDDACAAWDRRYDVLVPLVADGRIGHHRFVATA